MQVSYRVGHAVAQRFIWTHEVVGYIRRVRELRAVHEVIYWSSSTRITVWKVKVSMALVTVA